MTDRTERELTELGDPRPAYAEVRALALPFLRAAAALYPLTRGIALSARGRAIKKQWAALRFSAYEVLLHSDVRMPALPRLTDLDRYDLSVQARAGDPMTVDGRPCRILADVLTRDTEARLHWPSGDGPARVPFDHVTRGHPT